MSKQHLILSLMTSAALTSSLVALAGCDAPDDEYSQDFRSGTDTDWGASTGGGGEACTPDPAECSSSAIRVTSCGEAVANLWQHAVNIGCSYGDGTEVRADGIGQEITPCADLVLATAKLPVGLSFDPYNASLPYQFPQLTLSVYSEEILADPMTPPLAVSQSVDSSNLPVEPNFWEPQMVLSDDVTFTFANPPTLAAGVKYVLILKGSYTGDYYAYWATRSTAAGEAAGLPVFSGDTACQYYTSTGEPWHQNPLTVELRAPYCGDGVVSAGEACDDGNSVDGDGCTNACVQVVCGDGVVGPGEECDDGNANDTDACTIICRPGVRQTQPGAPPAIESGDQLTKTEVLAINVVEGWATTNWVYVRVTNTGSRTIPGDATQYLDVWHNYTGTSSRVCNGHLGKKFGQPFYPGAVREGWVRCDTGPKQNDGCPASTKWAGASLYWSGNVYNTANSGQVGNRACG